MRQIHLYFEVWVPCWKCCYMWTLMLEFSPREVINIHETQRLVICNCWRLHNWANFRLVQISWTKNINRFIVRFVVFFEKKTMFQNLLRRYNGKLFHLWIFLLYVSWKEVILSSKTKYQHFWQYHRATHRKRVRIKRQICGKFWKEILQNIIRINQNVWFKKHWNMYHKWCKIFFGNIKVEECFKH